MASLKQRNDAVSILWRRVLLAALIFVFIILTINVWGLYRKERESALMRMQATNHYQDLVERQNTLEANINSLETDRGKEEALRGSYDVGKKGEQLIVIVDPSTTTLIQATSTPDDWLGKLFWWW